MPQGRKFESNWKISVSAVKEKRRFVSIATVNFHIVVSHFIVMIWPENPRMVLAFSQAHFNSPTVMLSIIV